MQQQQDTGSGQRRGAAALAGVLFIAAAIAAWWYTGRQPPAGATVPVARIAAPAGAGAVPVIIYLIDTLRADRLSLYGYGKPTSPTIDSIASESVVFDRAYSAAPWTLPSLAAILTSRPVCEHGVIRASRSLPPSVETLAQKLNRSGYQTAAYYQNAFAGSGSGLDRGYTLSEFRNDLETLDLDAAEFLKNVGTKPYLLYLHSMEPHALYFVPPQILQRTGFVSVDDRERYKAHWTVYRMFMYHDLRNKLPIGTTDTSEGLDLAIQNLRNMRPSISDLYDGGVNFADDELAQAIAVLKKTGAWNKALFILMADHGEELDDHGLWFHDQSVYEELTHVPLLIHFPDGAAAGRRISERVSLLDVMPTILDYLGSNDACEGCKGQSLLPLLAQGAESEYVSLVTPSMRLNAGGYYRPLKQKIGDINVVVREGPLKAIWNVEPDRLELYDLSSDPGEKRDLSLEQAGTAAALRDRARQWLHDCRTPPDASTVENELDEETKERLRAHGYFQ
jgi:arylsulfatase A-like enzyme